MLISKSIIKSLMSKRGYTHRRQEDDLTINGEYSRNLQYVYSKSIQTGTGVVIDLIYFGVDIGNEKLVVGMYRENADVQDGVLVNTSQSLKLKDFNAAQLEKLLDKLIPPLRVKAV